MTEVKTGSQVDVKSKEEEGEDEEDLFADADDDVTAVKLNSEDPVSASNVKFEQEALKYANEGSKATVEVKEDSIKNETSAVNSFVIDREPLPAVPTSTVVAETSSIQTTAIPRKSGAKYGLPDGAKIPASVENKKLLHGKILESLKSLPVQLVNEALTEYDDAVQIKGDSIRNHSAYLMGVIRRYVDVQVRSSQGDTTILPLGEALTPAVQKRLSELVQTGFCTEEEMNEKVKGKIRMLSEKDALIALDELASVDRSQIRNVGSYFMGIVVKRLRGGETGDSRGAGRHDSRSDSRRGGRDSADRHYRDNRSDSYRRDNRSRERERSRDRYEDDRRNDRYGHGPDRDRDLSQYGPPRQQQISQVGYSGQPQQFQLNGGGMLSGPPPIQQQQMPGTNAYSHQQPQQQMQQPFFMQQNPQQAVYPSAPNQQQQEFVQNIGSQNRPVMAPTSFVGQHPQQQHNMMMQPQMLQPQMLQPENHPQQQQQPFMMNAQMMNPQQQQYMQQQLPMGARAPPPPNQTGWQQQQQQQQNPYMQHNQQGQAQLDILGLADKAASAVQDLLGGQNRSQHMPSYSSTNQPPVQQYAQNQVQIGQMPYGNAAVPYGNISNNSSANANNSQQNPRHRATTTASLNDLPVMVQYTVQNLQATGAVDNALDGGMLGMIADLPEDLALAALQKFATIDKNTMRNKTAYLAGVLRRELERIHRR